MIDVREGTQAQNISIKKLHTKSAMSMKKKKKKKQKETSYHHKLTYNKKRHAEER